MCKGTIKCTTISMQMTFTFYKIQLMSIVISMVMWKKMQAVGQAVLEVFMHDNTVTYNKLWSKQRHIKYFNVKLLTLTGVWLHH